MPIDERRELNKSSTRYKSRAFGKADPVAVACASDGKSKALRGRARSRKDPPLIIMHPDLLPKGKETVKADDFKRCMSPPKQPLKKDNAKPLEAKLTSSVARLKASMKGCPGNVSVEVRGNCHAGSQRSLELMFIRKREATHSPQASDGPRLTVPPVRRSSASPKPSPTPRPATAPAPLGKSLPSFSKGSGCWRPSAPSPEVLLWIPQGTSLEEASERAKNFLSGNFPPRPPLNRQAPVLAGPPVTSRKTDGRPFSASSRKIGSRNEYAGRGPLASTLSRPNELWRSRFSRLLQKNTASGEAGGPSKIHSPPEGRSRPQSPAPRVGNEAAKRRTLGSAFHPTLASRRNERPRLTEPTPTSAPLMSQRWGKRPDSASTKKMVHMCKSCAPMEGGRFFSEMAAFLPVRKDTLVILKPFDCRAPQNDPMATIQKSLSETPDTIPQAPPVTIRTLESEIEVIKGNHLHLNFTQFTNEPTIPPQITESDAEIEVIKEPSGKVPTSSSNSTPSNASPEKVQSPVNTAISMTCTGSPSVNPSPDCKSPTCLETTNEVICKSSPSGELREKTSLPPVVDSTQDMFGSANTSTQEQSSNCNSVNTHSTDTIVTQVSKSFSDISKMIANEEKTATKVDESCEAVKNGQENPAYFLCDLLGKCKSSSNETVSEKILSETRGIRSPSSFHGKSSSSMRIPTPHMSEVFCVNKCRYGGIPSTTIAKLLSPAMVGTYSRLKPEETHPFVNEQEGLPYESKLESILQANRLSGCSLDQSPPSSSTSQSSNLGHLPKNESATANKEHDQQKLAHNVYVTYVSPLIVQSQGTEDENNTRNLSNLVNDLVTNRDALKPSVTKPSKKPIPSTLNSIKEEAAPSNEKPAVETPSAVPSPERQTNSLLSNIRLMQKHISAIRGNGAQGSPGAQLEQVVIATGGSKSPSKSSLMPSEEVVSSPGVVTGSVSRVQVTESFWTALDRLVQCQEEVINAFASYSDSCEAFSMPFRRNTTLQTEEEQPSRASEGSRISSSVSPEEEEHSMGTWEMPPLSDSYESEDDYSSARQDRTYRVPSPRSPPPPLLPCPAVASLPPRQDSVSRMSSDQSRLSSTPTVAPSRAFVSVLNSTPPSSMTSAAGKSSSTTTTTTGLGKGGREYMAEGKWRRRALLEPTVPRRTLPSKGLRALKARSGVSTPSRRSAIWRKGQARTGNPLAQQAAAAAVVALARGKVRGGKPKDAMRCSVTPVSAVTTTARRQRTNSVSPCSPAPRGSSPPQPPPTPPCASHAPPPSPQPSLSSTLSSKGMGSAVMSLSELLKQATGGKLTDVGEKFDKAKLAARLKRKSPCGDMKDGVVTKDEEIFCPDARCSVRLTPQTLLPHLASSHRQALSTIARPGHAVSVSLRPADLMPAVPCIAAFLHVTDRMDFGPFLLMVATSRDAGSVNGNGSSTPYSSSPSSFTSSGLGMESPSSPSSAEGVIPGVRKVFPALPPPPSSSPRPDITLIAWLVEIHPRSSCTVRVLRRCDCSRRLCAAASYTGDTVALRRSQRLEDVLATGAYVVAHPQLLARLQQCGGEVEVSATVLPGYASDEDASCGDDWSLHEDSSVYEAGPGEISIVEEESEVSEETANAPPIHACLTIPCA